MSILNMDSFVPSLWLVPMIALGVSEHVWFAGLAMGTTLQSVRGEERLQSVTERGWQADLFANGIGPAGLGVMVGPAGLGVMDGMLVALHSMLLILMIPPSTFKPELRLLSTC